MVCAVRCVAVLDSRAARVGAARGARRKQKPLYLHGAPAHQATHLATRGSTPSFTRKRARPVSYDSFNAKSKPLRSRPALEAVSLSVGCGVSIAFSVRTRAPRPHRAWVKRSRRGALMPTPGTASCRERRVMGAKAGSLCEHEGSVLRSRLGLDFRTVGCTLLSCPCSASAPRKSWSGRR